jgi:hypothetical protein
LPWWPQQGAPAGTAERQKAKAKDASKPREGIGTSDEGN